jgi:hypothetical protein
MRSPNLRDGIMLPYCTLEALIGSICIVPPIQPSFRSHDPHGSISANTAFGLEVPPKIIQATFHSPHWHSPQSEVYWSPLSAYTETRVIQYDASATLCSDKASSERLLAI